MTGRPIFDKILEIKPVGAERLKASQKNNGQSDDRGRGDA
jgi:hypothetical protein